MQALRVLNTILRSGQYRHSASREEYFRSPVFLKKDAPASKRPDFSPHTTVIALAALVRPHDTSDSDRRDGNPMATIRGGVIGWYKNRILTRRLS
jgi:hypothetical protein